MGTREISEGAKREQFPNNEILVYLFASFVFGALFLGIVVFFPQPDPTTNYIGDAIFLGAASVFLYAAARPCHSCHKPFARMLPSSEAAVAFRFHFQKGVAPPARTVRSAVASKLDLDERNVFVEVKKPANATAATVTLPKAFVEKKDSAAYHEEVEKSLEEELSELWTAEWAGRASLKYYRCRWCGYMWTEVEESDGF